MSEWTISVDDLSRPISLCKSVSAYLRKMAELRLCFYGSQDETLNNAAIILEGIAEEAEKLRNAGTEFDSVTENESGCE